MKPSGYRWVWDREARVWLLGYPRGGNAWAFVSVDNWIYEEEFTARFTPGPEVLRPEEEPPVTPPPPRYVVSTRRSGSWQPIFMGTLESIVLASEEIAREAKKLAAVGHWYEHMNECGAAATWRVERTA